MITRLLFLLLLLPSLAGAVTIDEIAARDRPPAGVVFEIVQGQADALDWAIPRVAADARRLRERFPGLPVAVVSHGFEQFALKRDGAAPGLHRQVQDLVSDDVPVHVCGTHASWYDVTAEDFPDYIDVAPSGPAQINAYRELGYELLIVTRD